MDGMYTLPGGAQPQQRQPGGLPAFIRGIQGFADRPARREAAAQYITLISQRLRRHDTPYGNQLADVFEQNPRGFIMFANQMGGMNAIDQMLAQQAQQQYQQSLLSMMPTETPEQALAVGLGGGKEAFETAKAWGELGPEQYEPQTQIEKLQEALRQARARGDDKAAQEIENALVKAQFGTGMELEFTPGGGFRYQTNVLRGQQGMTPTIRSKLQTNVIDYTNRMARLEALKDAFDPSLHKIPTKLWSASLELYEKFKKGEETLTGEEQRLVEDLATYRTAAYRELNATLRELSGAAVNPSEAARLLQQVVNVGEHWWQGDSATVARRKYETALMMIARSKARTVYMLQHPREVAAGKYSLDRIYDIMLDRAGQEMDRLKKQFPDIGDDALRARLNGIVLQEFGVGINSVMDPRDVRRQSE